MGKAYSPSRINSALDGGCDYAHGQRYVMGDRRGSSGKAMTIGTTVHHNAEVISRLMMEGGQKPKSVDECLEVTNTFLETVNFDSIGDVETEEDVAEIETKSRAFVQTWFDEVLPTIHQPQAVEETLYATIEWNDHPYEIMGIVDLIDIDPATNDYRIRDLKTGAKFSPSQFDNGIQLSAYVVLAAANNFATKKTRIDHLRHLKSGPVYTALELERDQGHILHLAILLEQVRLFEEGGVFKPNPLGWKCNARCGYWNTCEFRKPDSI